MRPRIVVTLDTGRTERRGVPFELLQLKAAYANAVERAGGLPILVAPTTDEAVRAELLELADGLVITGGDFDIDPTLFGEGAPAGVRVDPPKPLRTAFEWALAAHALAHDVPMLGICGGMQLMNVVLGGTLHLHIPDAIDGALEHEQPTSPATPDHDVLLEPGIVASLVSTSTVGVNSTHHQAVALVGDGLRVEGRAPDGVIEAIAHQSHPFAVGVQWHPELLGDALSDALYAALVKNAKR